MKKPVIVVNRTDAIGDTVLTLPMLRALKEEKPDSRLIFLVSQKSQDLTEVCCDIDEVWCLDRNLSFWSQFLFLHRKFKATQVDAYFYVGGSHLPSFFAWLSSVAFIGGLKSKWPSFLFLRNGQRQKRAFVSMHEAEYNIILLKDYLDDHNFISKKFIPQIELSQELIKKNLDDFYQKISSHFSQSLDEIKSELKDKKWLLVHPGMTGHTLNWPMKSYARLVFNLYQDRRESFLFIVSYTPSDQVYIDELKFELDRLMKAGPLREDEQMKIYFFNGAEHGLVYYMSLLKHVSAFIGPSTGTTHLASLLEVPLLAIYSPIKVQSALRWGPYIRTDQTHVLTPDVICGEIYKCAGSDCPYFECMPKLEIEKVTDLLHETINAYPYEKG